MKKGLPPYVYLRKGKPYYERRGFPSRRIQADPGTPEFAVEYASIVSGVTPVSRGQTFQALIASYRRDKRFTKLATRTKSDYDKVLEYIDTKFGSLCPGDMERKDIIRARDTNADTLRFANYIVQVLRILFEHAIDKGWIKANPAKGVSLLKSEEESREAWPQKLIDAYRKAASGKALLIFELCLGTGQRISDVLRMKWSDIEAGGINVNQQKTRQKLWIPISPRLQEVLDGTPRLGETICAWGSKGKPMAYRSAADLVMAVRKMIGAEDYDVHSLRYTTTAELAALGCTDDQIMAITGHKSLAMVTKYAGPARQKARAKQTQEMRDASQTDAGTEPEQ